MQDSALSQQMIMIKTLRRKKGGRTIENHRYSLFYVNSNWNAKSKDTL